MSSTSASLLANAGKNGVLFKANLDGSLSALVGKARAPQSTSTSTSTSTPANAASDPLTAQLTQQIRAQLDRGISLDTIVQQLAATLATQVAAQLGTSTKDATERLTTAFTQALSSSGSGPPATTNVERASSLATRVRQLADLATRVMTEDPGQTIRQIAGTSLDANAAGANPTPTTTTTKPTTATSQPTATSPTTATAQGAVTTPATATTQPAVTAPTTTTSTKATSRSTDSTTTTTTKPSTGSASGVRVVAVPVPVSPVPLLSIPVPIPTATPPTSPAPVDDGGRRVVSLPSLPVSTGGDTLLGRVLTRAWLNQPPLSGTPVTVLPSATPSAATDGTTVPQQPGVSTTAVTATATASTTRAAASILGTTSTPARPVDAFLHAFATALAQHDSARPLDTGSQVPVPADATSAPATSAPALTGQVPFAIGPITNDAASVTPSAPAPTLPQPQHVDANAVVDQVLRGVAIRTTDGSSEVRLRLVPEQLGDVSVKLVVSGGNVDASITAHSADAQSALAGGQAQLAKTLADAGLKLQSFSVGLAGGNLANTSDQRRQDQQPGRSTSTRRISGIGATDDEPLDELNLLAAPSFGPPLYTASRGMGALNYLV